MPARKKAGRVAGLEKTGGVAGRIKRALQYQIPQRSSVSVC